MFTAGIGDLETDVHSGEGGGNLGETKVNVGLLEAIGATEFHAKLLQIENTKTLPSCRRLNHYYIVVFLLAKSHARAPRAFAIPKAPPANRFGQPALSQLRAHLGTCNNMQLQGVVAQRKADTKIELDDLSAEGSCIEQSSIMP